MSLVNPRSRTALTVVGKELAERALSDIFERGKREWRNYATKGPSRYQGTSGATLGTIASAAGLNRQDSGVEENSGVFNSNSRGMRGSTRSSGGGRRGGSSGGRYKKKKYRSKRRGRKTKKSKSRTVRRRYTGRVSGSSMSQGSRYKIDRAQIAYRGYSLTQEYGGEVSNPWNAILGHSTHHFNMMMRSVIGAMVKLALQKANLMLGNPNAANSTMAIDDRFILRYRPESTDQAATESTIITTVSNTPNPGTGIAPNTMSRIITDLTWQLGQALGSFESRKPQFIFTSFTFSPDGSTDSTKVVINLMGARVKYFAESGFTLQNITANEATDAETTDVDSLPVKGYTYEGPGSGTTTNIATELSGADRVSFLADRDGFIYGYGDVFGSGLTTETGRLLAEPVEKSVLSHCRKRTQVMVPSGGVHIDNLHYYRSVLLDQLVTELWNFHYAGVPSVTGAASKIRYSFGKYKLYMLEKVIEFTGKALSPAIPVKIRYEKNQALGMLLIPKKQKQTVRENFINEKIPGVSYDATP